MENKQPIKSVPVAQPAEISTIERAENAAKAMREANDLFVQSLERAEKLRAREILGGNTTAGQVPVEVIETPQEYAKKVMRGQL
jgi:hypothetical protein